MIEFPLEVGVLGWASTLIFGIVVVLAAWKIVRAIRRK